MKDTSSPDNQAMKILKLDELDLALINAMQVNGRASWSLIGGALGVSAVTAARRWESLASEGIAWMTAYGGPLMWDKNCLAFVEVDCAVGESNAIATQIAGDPFAASVEFADGGTNLFLTIVISDLTALSTYVRDRVSSLQGVVATRVHLATRVYTEASRWRLNALSPSQKESLTPRRLQTLQETSLLEVDQALVVALGMDGRRTGESLAEELGIGASTVRRRLKHLTDSDTLRFRCDVASSYTDWPVLVNYRAVCSPSDVDAVGRRVSSFREVRVCAATLGAHNMLFTVWLKSASSSLALETRLASDVPQMEITHRSITLHSIKRFGRLLDERGRSIGAVPMDMWRQVNPGTGDPWPQQDRTARDRQDVGDSH